MHVREAFRDRVDNEDGTPPSVDQMRAALEPIQGEAPNYWEAWWDQYDYVYMVFTQAGQENPMPDQLQLVVEGPRFQLYRVVREQPPG